jgi:CheY-like chemotaxis protein
MIEEVNVMAQPHILSVGSDPSLLESRRIVLQQAGYTVTTAVGFIEAMQQCRSGRKFDTVIICHSLPQRDKHAIAAAFRANCPSPLVAIRKSWTEQPPVGAIVI